MHIKDLDVCRYHTGPFYADNWAVPLRAVGWLEHPQYFTTGVASIAFASKLSMIVEQVRSAYPHFGFRGVKDCSLCLCAGLKSPGPIWSQENIFIPGSGVVYVAPGESFTTSRRTHISRHRNSWSPFFRVPILIQRNIMRPFALLTRGLSHLWRALRISRSGSLASGNETSARQDGLFFALFLRLFPSR